ncbi:MAG TPA: ClbS/DfsB family four-helix bundle protein [Blastocatellia bacterium]|nr:ClbS/DfsB family four-helix bundle protein [Blastocatellia bacterium]
MNRSQLLEKLDKRWTEFNESYAGLSDSQMTESRVTGDWSVKDIIAHVTWWEQEALKHLPLITKGGRPRTYAAEYGGIDAFNALMTEQKRRLSLSEVLRQRDETHQRLVLYIESVPEEQCINDKRFRRRLRLDTYGHYPKHAKAIRAWREKPGLDVRF